MGIKIKLQSRAYEELEGGAAVHGVVEQDFGEKLSKDLRVGVG